MKTTAVGEDEETMKEHPIIFTGESVRAILSRAKTMTRRVVRFPEWFDGESITTGTEDIWFHARFPYGTVGDHLWVRETWARGTAENGTCSVAYRADNEYLAILAENGGEGDPVAVAGCVRPYTHASWKSPIFMPRWASRITLEITSLRVERLREISDDDIAAEGIEVTKHAPGEFGIENPCATGTVDLPKEVRLHSTARCCFAAAWNAINGKKWPWTSNPWVWVISFKRLIGE